MSSPVKFKRRTFIQYSLAAGGALVVGIRFAESGRAAEDSVASLQAHALVRFEPDGTTIIRFNRPEMGQGTKTAMPMLIADDLDADWDKVRVEWAPVEDLFDSNGLRYSVGGSASIRTNITRFRRFGAGLREIFVIAAAKRWGVPPSSCATDNSVVVHAASARRLPYAALLEDIPAIPFPEHPKLKTKDQLTLIGKWVRAVDIKDRVTGGVQFGIDADVPGQCVGMVVRPPVRGGKLKSFDAAKARAMAGVKLVQEIETGVGIVADSFWTAKKARDGLEITWDEGPLAGASSRTLTDDYRKAFERDPDLQPFKDETLEQELAKRNDAITAEYQAPFEAHAALEPMNCTAHIEDGRARIWVPTQNPLFVRRVVRSLTGLADDEITVYPLQMGGSFGRKYTPDYVHDAVLLSKAAGAPVKAIWTREDDMRQSPYRPFSIARLSSALDEDGLPIGIAGEISGTSFRLGDRNDLERVRTEGHGLDHSMTEGMAPPNYPFSRVSMKQFNLFSPISTMWWRSVGNSHTAFYVESFIDELAQAAGEDPLEYRLRLLDMQHPMPPPNTPKGADFDFADRARMQRLLGKLQEVSGWATKRAAGKAIGMACWYSFETYVAEAAEVSMQGGKPSVDRVFAVVDCGIAVNPSTIEQQIAGSVVFALGAAMKSEITFKDGAVVEGNYGAFPVVRINECPEIEVTIIAEGDKIGGMGEPGVPPLAPAVANGIFAATGKRPRIMPFLKNL